MSVATHAPPTTEDDVENPAAWHPDPAGKHDHRWWDGQRWTEHVADAGVASVDPLPPAPGATDAAAGGSASQAVDAGPAATGATDPGAGDPGAADPAATDPGATDAHTPGTGDTAALDIGDGTTAGSDPAEPTVTDHAGDLGVGAAAAGTAGATPASEQPVWGHQPADGATQQPWGTGTEQEATSQQATGEQQPWGGAPAAAAPWTQQQPSWGPEGGAAPASNGMAIGALVTGIVALPLLIFIGLGGLIGGIVAVILGIIALRRVKRGTGSGRGLAIGGVVLGAISIVMGLLIFIFFLGIFGELADCMEETGNDSEECQRRLTEQLIGS